MPLISFLKGPSNFPPVRGTSMKKCEFVFELCKGHHSERTGHNTMAIVVGAMGLF